MKRILTVVLLGLGTSAASAASLSKHQMQKLHRNPALHNFSALSREVLRGGNPGDEGLRALAAAGVKTVVSWQGGDLDDAGWLRPGVAWWEPGETDESIAREEALAKKLGMKFVSKRLSSLSKVNGEGDQMIREVLAFMHDPALQPVYVHCQHGVDRTGLIAALYRIRYQGWRISSARREWAAFGHATAAPSKWLTTGWVNYAVTGNLNEYFERTAPELREAWLHENPRQSVAPRPSAARS